MTALVPVLLLASIAVPGAAAAESQTEEVTAAATAASGDWRGARWGMTVEQVLAAFAGQAVRLAPPERLADGNVVEVGIERERVEGAELRVRFVFASGELALVSLRTPPETYAEPALFERLEKALAQKFGSPGDASRDDNFLDLRQTRWTLDRSIVDLKYIPGVVVILYHPAPGPARDRR